MLALLLASTALAGDLSTQASVDGLVATSKNAGPGAGQPESMAAAELGLRLKADLRELDGRLGVHLDYRGRVPIAGLHKNRSLSLIYRAEARFTLVEDLLIVGVGRFIAPSPIFLPVDGASLSVRRDGWNASVFGGRRAISTGRRNVGFGTFLPAVGGTIGRHHARYSLEASLSWSQDQLRIAAASDAIEQAVGGLSGAVKGHARPVDAVSFGGQVAVQQQATYQIGPTWSEATVEVQALDLFNALGWASIKPVDALRVDLDVLTQTAQVWSAGTLAGDDAEGLSEPTFTDMRLRVRIGPPKIGWLRPMVRYRIRPDRTELRAAVRMDLNDFGVPGLFATMQGAVDNISGESQKQDVGPRDRTFGSAAAGFRESGLDLRLGASYVERAASPVSGRTVNAAAPGQPTTSDDLQPFTLQADPILFARAFYSGRRWFVGGDFEKHLSEPEVRAFLQVGINAEVGW